MEDKLIAFYRSADMDILESEHLLLLRENCAAYEARVKDIAERILPEDGQMILAYIDYRDELEIETVKAALCCPSNSKTPL